MLPSSRVHTAIRVALLTCSLVVGLLVAAPPTTAQAAAKAPTGLTYTSRSSNAVRLKWKPVSKAAAYLVKYSTSSKLKHPKYVKTTASTVEIGKLKASRKYYFKVRALKANGKALTKYGKTKKVTTRSKKSYSVLSPAGFAATGINGDELTLGWTAQGSTNRYLVRRSTRKSMTSPKNVTVSGTSLLVEGLKRATPYYFTVEVISSKGKAISQRSGVRKATTAKLVTFGTPGGLAVSQANPTQITVAWASVRRAPLYQVAIAPGTWDETTYAATRGTSATVDGLIANTTYLVRLRVLDASGNPAGEFSPATKVTTPKAEAALRVASYNVHCHTCSPTTADPAANDQPWTVRRDYVVDTIRKADPDVVALQEAQQSKLKSAGDTGLTQFEDLAKRMGPEWALTNPNRYNCTNPDSDSCTFAAPLTNTLQGASSGTKIVYRKDRLVLKGQGSMQLTPLSATSKQRFVAWAFLQQRSTGKKFLFADIHLEPGNDSDDVTVRDSWCGTKANPLCTLNRQVQARDALDKLTALNGDKLPIVLAGDAASSRAEVGGNLPYPILTTQLVDPLGGMSYTAPAVAPAQTRINIAFNSVNKYDRLARRYAPSSETTYNPATNNLYNGAYNDYILVSPTVRISEFEQVVNVDGTGRFVGVIPSDHNLISATLWLP